jgi:REP element-mobilizing transposase RayT
MWNDTDIPLAFLVTFRTRGTWLHGDEKGSVNRENNVYGTPMLSSSQGWESYNLEKLKGQPVILSPDQRAIVHEAVKATCKFRGWGCHAVNVRSNHAHAVVAGGEAGAGKVLHALKANATRSLRENSLWSKEYSPWADKGSQRYLWTQQSITNAIDYVLYSQGDDFLYTE